MNKWTKESAERAASKHIGSGKVIFLDGQSTLKECSAFDYLANHCGYIYGVKKVEVEK